MCQPRESVESAPFGPFPDLTPCRPRRSLLWGNIARICGATSVLLATLAPTAGAQDQPSAVSPPVPSTPLVDTLKPPAPAEAMRGYRTLEAWVRDWNLPEAPVQEAAFLNVSATIRLDGLVVGRGTSHAKDGSSLYLAAKEAMSEAERRLPWPHDALGEKARREEAGRMLLSVEFGGAPVPFAAQTWAEFDLLVQAGREGLAVRVGELEAVMFPSQMSAAGYAPSEGAIALLARVSGDAGAVIRTDPKSQPAKLSKDRGAVFYKFPVVHLAQTEKGQSPAFMFRGGRVIAEGEITTPALRKLAADLAANIGARVQRVKQDAGASLAEAREVAVLDGTLRLGERGENTAGAFETLLTIQALRDFSTLDMIERADRERAAKLAADLFAGLTPVGGDVPQMSETAAAAIVIAATTPSMIEGGVPEALLNAAKETVAKAYNSESHWPKSVPVGARALVAHALVRMQSPDAESAVRSVFAETSPKMLVAQMPYLGWAELELAAGKSGVPAGAALREMREGVWGHQLTSLDAGEDGPDLVGGIVFTNTAQPLPTWLSLKPVAFLATMARDERLTAGDERLKEIVRLARACRFVRQLAADEFVVHAAGDPARALWGVRAAAWEQRQPPEAQALALLAVDQTLRTLAPPAVPSAKTP